MQPLSSNSLENETISSLNGDDGNTMQFNVSGTRGSDRESTEKVNRDIQAAMNSLCIQIPKEESKPPGDTTNKVTETTANDLISSKDADVQASRRHLVDDQVHQGKSKSFSYLSSPPAPVTTMGFGTRILWSKSFSTDRLSRENSINGSDMSQTDERRDPKWQVDRARELSAQINAMLGTEPIDATKSDEGCFRGTLNESDKNSKRHSVGGDIADVHNFANPLNLYRVPDGVMQVFIMSLVINQEIKRPYVVVTFGDQVFNTSVSSKPSGDWNEGFELIVSYHMQLFGTIHFDVYDKSTLLADRFIGRAELRPSHLEGFPEVFTNFHEIWDKKQTLSSLPEQQHRTIISKNIGAIQVRVNYRYQKFEDPEPKITRIRGVHLYGRTGVEDNKRQDEGEPSDPTEMNRNELMSEFSKEYMEYMAESDKLGSSLLMKGPQQNGIARSDSVGFDRTEDSSQPSTPPTMESTSPNSSTGTSSSPWFFTSWFTSSPTSIASNSSDYPGKTNDIYTIEEDIVREEQNNVSLSQKPVTEVPPVPQDITLLQSLSSMFLAPSTYKVMKSISSIASSFGQGLELSNSEVIGGLMTLNRFFADPKASFNDNTSESSHRLKSCLNQDMLMLPARYAKFALASYGWRALYIFSKGITLIDGARVNSDVNCVLQYLKLPESDLIGYNFQSQEVFRSCYFIARDKEHDALVLSIRGTMSLKDTLVDLACEYEKWCGGLVHSGMKASAYWVLAKVVPQMLAFAQKQGIKNIRFVGHSLGASTAAILTILLLESSSMLKELGVDIESLDIKAFCYGPAPCVSENLAERYKDHIQTFVNSGDIVPRLCYGSFMDFKQMIVAAASETDNLSQSIYNTFQAAEMRKKVWDERFERLSEVRKALHKRGDNTCLFLPGKVYHIVVPKDTDGPTVDKAKQDDSKEDDAKAKEKKPHSTWIIPTTQEYFRELVLQKSMIIDHFPSSYEVAFEKALDTLNQSESARQR
ncbi:hypothetical protein H4219_002346 [Mycoemilia scoparia]|uniref:sn-1-specific diacylglycerol lipase n=1 Tax=Mycoemilia scoparia TaxID=417184 RepID=A0A9W8A2T1_9FUNG|nr:hypothetical protein H4219_002346 [Mycoemilia scoparia]